MTHYEPPPIRQRISSNWAAHVNDVTGKAVEIVITDDVISVKVNGESVCELTNPILVEISDKRHHG